MISKYYGFILFLRRDSKSAPELDVEDPKEDPTFPLNSNMMK